MELIPSRPLVPDVWLAVFEFLPVRELLMVSRTCRAMRLLVKAYWPLAFNLARVLQPFLIPADVPSFRGMMKASGAIISGSVALQFLDRSSYPSSDLDIYVSHAHVNVVEPWLLEHGLTKVPRVDEPDATPQAYDRPLVIHSVEDFRAADSGRIVQLICTRRCPFSAILEFHSCRPLPLTSLPKEADRRPKSVRHEFSIS